MGAAVRSRDHKLVYLKAEGTRLYDLAKDPGETRSSFEPEVAGGLARRLEAYREQAEAGRGAPAPIDEELRARLRALGYAP